MRAFRESIEVSRKAHKKRHASLYTYGQSPSYIYANKFVFANEKPPKSISDAVLLQTFYKVRIVRYDFELFSLCFCGFEVEDQSR